MRPIEHLLRETMGLDAASIGSMLIERTVRLRMKSLGIKRAAEYHGLLQKSSAELNELIEAVVVTETWFFRDREPFRALVRLVLEEWVPVHPFGQLRLLSVPCSSGEEPYSMAMALLDAGLPPESFIVDAVDISARALARARRALYGRNSFRGKDLGFRDRYFQPTKDGYSLSRAVRRQVQFQRGNLLEESFPARTAAYDFIFFRNLLIYFDALTQRQAIQSAERLLTPAGVCFVGAAELPIIMNNGFVSVNPPSAFACRRAVPTLQVQSETRLRTAKAGDRRLPPLPPTLVPSDTNPHRRIKPVVDIKRRGKVKLVPSLDLEAARRLADEGKLGEAATNCEVILREHPAFAPAHYLLGLVRDAQGKAEAAEHYRKALYLDPNHYESLLQLALLAEKAGDVENAMNFRRRARRAVGTAGG